MNGLVWNELLKCVNDYLYHKTITLHFYNLKCQTACLYNLTNSMVIFASGWLQKPSKCGGMSALVVVMVIVGGSVVLMIMICL